MISFPEILRQNGYYTAQAGKFHMGHYARRGFDIINENNKLNGDGGEELWIKCLQERPQDKPFLMWFAAYDAHRVWGPNEFSGTHDPEMIRPPYYLAQGWKTKEISQNIMMKSHDLTTMLVWYMKSLSGKMLLIIQ